MTTAQGIIGGIFYCRDSEDFNVSASNIFSCNVTDSASKSAIKHTANRCIQFKIMNYELSY